MKNRFKVQLKQLENLKSLVAVDRQLINSFIIQAEGDNDPETVSRLNLIKLRISQEESDRKVSRLIARHILKKIKI